MSKKSKNNLVTLGSAAVLTVYAAGYLRTKQAALLFADESSARRPRTDTVGMAAPAGRPDGVAASPAQRPDAPVATAVGAVASSPATAAPVTTNTARDAKSPETKQSSVAAAPASPAGTAAEGASSSAPADTASQQPAEHERGPYGKDGTFLGWGSSRHGDIQASVEIRDGRIYEAKITQCLTRYSCSWIWHLQAQVAARQSPEIDYVSGATQSVNAFYYAVVEALKQAK